MQEQSIFITPSGTEPTKTSPVSPLVMPLNSTAAPTPPAAPVAESFSATLDGTGFDQFPLSPKLKQAIAKLGFKAPTEIQAKSIPLALSHQDLIGSAQTGTGKTAAFSIPLITKLELNPKLSALILVPTREIAAQISTVLRDLTFFLPEIKLALLMGGASMQNQMRMLSKHPRILIATPGRLMDHLRRGSVKLTTTGILVLDEADRMLDMGFAPQLNEILRYLPKERQTLLFSATVPSDIENLAKRYLQKPQRITVGHTSQAAPKIEQTVIHSSHSEKNSTLLDELNQRTGSVLIFTRTKRRTDKLSEFLTEYGHEVNRIHGDRSQAQRNSALNSFRMGKVRILVATDVAARGIDVPHIAHVINYDLPQTPDDYIHRIGRTARAGAKGEALSILTPEDNSLWRQISRMLTRSGSNAPTAKNAAKSETRSPIPAVSPMGSMPSGSGDASNNGYRPYSRPQGRPRPERSREFSGGGDFRSESRPRGRDFGDRKPFGSRNAEARGGARQERGRPAEGGAFGAPRSAERGNSRFPSGRPHGNGSEPRRPRSFF